MRPGLLHYQSATYGKLKCIFDSRDTLWDNPWDAMTMQGKSLGKFCFWHAAVVEGIDVGVTKICAEKFVEMRSTLMKELEETVEKFEVPIAAAKRERDAAIANKTPQKERDATFETWCAYNRGQINAQGLGTIIKYWQYSEDLHGF